MQEFSSVNNTIEPERRHKFGTQLTIQLEKDVKKQKRLKKEQKKAKRKSKGVYCFYNLVIHLRKKN